MATVAPPSFAAKAQPYVEVDAAVFPTGGDDGKRPLVRGFTGFRGSPSPATLETWNTKFPDANVALATGAPSQVTVLDIDQPRKLDAMLARCGNTPALAQTPRSGFHAYYQHAGERSVTGLEDGVDVRGVGEIIIAPPSVRPDTGASYQWLKGGPDTLRDLPQARPGSLLQHVGALPSERLLRHVGVLPSDIPQGQRHQTLLKAAVRYARGAESEAHLLMMLEAEAEHCALGDHPVTDAELADIAAWTWEKKEAGELWARGEPGLRLDLGTFHLMLDQPQAWTLYQFLLTQHGSRTEPWAFVVTRVWEEKLLPGWGRDTIWKAFHVLIDRGLVRCVHKGRGPGDPSRYVFAY